MSNRNVLNLAVTAVAAAVLWSLLRQIRSHRRHPADVVAKPPAVTAWEGEGGALSKTGSQIGPEPALP